MIELTQEQVQALGQPEAAPPRVVNPQTRETFVLVPLVEYERLIEENKERYYEVLEQSSQEWHDGKHDPWPAMNFLLFILTQACKEFEQRVGQVKTPRGAKTELIIFLTPHIIQAPTEIAALTESERAKSDAAKGLTEKELNQFLDKLPRDPAPAKGSKSRQ